MLFFYLMSFLPISVGTFIFVARKEVNWKEYVGGTAIALATSAVFHAIAIYGMTGDIETWSGQIEKSVHYPEWVERYEEAVYKTVTDSKGHSSQVFSHYETRYRTHRERWEAETSIPSEHEISEGEFNEIVGKFNSLEERDGHKSGFYSGDPNIYVSENRTGYVFPATATRRWQNKIKAAPSVFSFSKVPKTAKVYAWPENSDWRVSDRLLGTASVLVDKFKFDQMNAKLGPAKKVNVILAGWGREDSSIGQMQEAAWIGGKKNDLVICFGGATKKAPAKWAYVFGWTESDLVKRNLETLMLSNPVNDNLIDSIQQEVKKNYKIKDWKKFDYISVEPPAWSYWVYFLVMIVTQSAFYLWALSNRT